MSTTSFATPLKSFLLELAGTLWLTAHRVSSYALLNLLDEPALLAMAFC